VVGLGTIVGTAVGGAGDGSDVAEGVGGVVGLGGTVAGTLVGDGTLVADGAVVALAWASAVGSALGATVGAGAPAVPHALSRNSITHTNTRLFIRFSISGHENGSARYARIWRHKNGGHGDT
jgi:hypothetical protein